MKPAARSGETPDPTRASTLRTWPSPEFCAPAVVDIVRILHAREPLKAGRTSARPPFRIQDTWPVATLRKANPSRSASDDSGDA